MKAAEIGHEHTVEVVVFLFLIVPAQVLSIFVQQNESIGFALMGTVVILRDLGLVSLVLFFLWRNGEGLRTIGVVLRPAWPDVMLGVALFLPFNLMGGLLDAWLRDVGLAAPQRPLPTYLIPRGGFEVVLAMVLVAVVAISEEIIFRGYLITRFRPIVRNAGALVLAAGVFALGHGYEGSAGMITVGAMGLVFGLIYAWRGNLVAAMVLHFLQDFTIIVLGSQFVRSG